VKGSYILILQLPAPLVALQVGRLGRFDFAAGFYLYIGSAMGSGGLEARLAHHQRRHKPHPHWHVDYLRAHARLREAWAVGAVERLECRWCRALAASPAVSIPVRGFGSRDTGCPAHLFYSARAPRTALLTGVILDEAAPGAAELQIEIYSFDE
jgi:Uri superfamily endonuclease